MAVSPDQGRARMLSAVLGAHAVYKASFSLVFCLTWILGDAYRRYDTYRGVLWDSGWYAFAGIVAFILWWLFLTVLDVLLKHLRLSRSDVSGAHAAPRISRLAPCRVYWLAFAALLVAWSPFVIAFFPGSMTHDAIRELQCFSGIIEWTTHHPVLPTVLMGSITLLGKSVFGTDIAAVGLYTFVHALFLSSVCSLVVRDSFVASRRLRIAFCALAFFAIVPVFGANAQTIWKDSLYMGFFVLFYVGIMRLVATDLLDAGLPSRAVRRRAGLMCATGGIAAALCRKEAAVIVILTIIVAFMVSFVRRRRTAKRGATTSVASPRALGALLMAVVVSFSLATYVLIPAAGIGEGSPAEALSLPLQQVARYAKHHPDALDAEEQELFGTFWDDGVDGVASLYWPSLSDPVKNAFNVQALQEFLEYYASWSLSHPAAFLEGLWATVYGYFYIGPSIGAPPVMVLFNETSLEQVYPYDYLETLLPLREALTSWCDIWANTPVLQWFTMPGLYTWVAIALLAWSVRERGRADLFVAFLPLILTVAAACMSPVDGYLRYVFGMVAVMPLTVVLTGKLVQNQGPRYAQGPVCSIAGEDMRGIWPDSRLALSGFAPPAEL